MCPPPPDDRKPANPRALQDDEDEPTRVGTIDAALVRAQTRRDRAYLIVLAGENLGQMFPVRETETVIGRAADAAVRLQDDGVSRRHAKIVVVGGEVMVEDLKSANGTLLNGQRVDRCVLQDGDKIQVGSTTILKFTYADRLEEDFQQKMYEAALHDGLTKAFTKRYFLDRLPTEIAYARRHSTPLSMLMLDVDHFKNVNDTYGYHPAGDYVLVVLGADDRQRPSRGRPSSPATAAKSSASSAAACRSRARCSSQATRLRGLIEALPFRLGGYAHQGDHQRRGRVVRRPP